MTTMEQEAHLALAAKVEAEQRIARLATCPPWRHAAFGGVMAALVVAQAVPLPLRFGLFALTFVAILLIVRSDRRRLGVFINGYRRGRTRLVTFPLLVIATALYAASVYWGVARDRPAVSVALGIVTFAVCYAGSVLWQRVFVRELGA